MSFIEAVKSAYQNYFTFSGRARRPAYWWFTLFSILVSLVISFIEGGWTGETAPGAVAAHYNAGPIAIVWALANFFPGLAVSVRRLHDTDRSGWWMLLLLIPLVGAIILIVWMASRGSAGPNRFGTEPAA